MRNLIQFIQKKYCVCACCCGHNKYPMTIVVFDDPNFIEIVSGKKIPRATRFYKRDKQGLYYIPETLEKA